MRIAALALLPNVEKQGGCSGLLVFGLFISLFIVNVDFASISKLYHAEIDDVATGLHHREIISRSAITSVFAQLSSKMSPYGLRLRGRGSEMVFGWFGSERDIDSSSLRAVPLFVPGGRSFVPACARRRAARKGRQGRPSCCPDVLLYRCQAAP